jgi:hypothetical protein
MRLSAGNYRHGETASITANLLEEKNQQESQKRGVRLVLERAGSDSNERRDVPSIARMIRLRLEKKILEVEQTFAKCPFRIIFVNKNGLGYDEIRILVGDRRD